MVIFLLIKKDSGSGGIEEIVCAFKNHYLAFMESVRKNSEASKYDYYEVKEVEFYD